MGFVCMCLFLVAFSFLSDNLNFKRFGIIARKLKVGNGGFCGINDLVVEMQQRAPWQKQSHPANNWIKIDSETLTRDFTQTILDVERVDADHRRLLLLVTVTLMVVWMPVDVDRVKVQMRYEDGPIGVADVGDEDSWHSGVSA
jgi:hypothetical protein